ncbi:hypothetical protein B7494_g4923 [Chlorociboria aeruginascens]|nr:hypothetical protein B7494_g4923 [Chlorociboria aeruginascens]
MVNFFGTFNVPLGFAVSFLKSQFTALPYPTTDFSGQTVIVTGANSGLGLEAARHFVRLNARKVILACRDIEKGEDAMKSIEETTARKGAVEVWQVDLSSYQSVTQFCARAQTLDRLDVVVENAGIAVPDYIEIEGMESTITVNVISTFLMALLLLPKLREDAVKFDMVPRLTIVASDVHEQALFKEQTEASIFTALKSPKYQQDRYNVSKLMEIFVVRELAPAMTASNKPKVILNTLTPGLCHSQLMRNSKLVLGIVAKIGKALFARTTDLLYQKPPRRRTLTPRSSRTEVGSRTLLAAAEAGEVTHGEYMADCKIRDTSTFVRSEKGKILQKRVYDELLDVLDTIEPGITNNI